LNARLDDPADAELGSVELTETEEDAEYLAYLEWKYSCWDDADDGREAA
jgi:hypothetical protein